MAASFVDDRNVPVKLGRELGRGGEGSVFEIDGTSLVAKIYHRPAEALKSDKLAAMVRLHSDALSSFAAWPERRILDKSGRQTWGIVMPKVAADHREIHHLYSPAHRKVDYPAADWSFLIHVARNCAAAFDSIHSDGHVVGDVNQGGVLVSRQGMVKLIDCDSFQIRDGSQVFTCDVGVPHFTAPELQGKSFRGLHRVQSHDSFGLAVLIFHLLFMGRHPFAGRFHGAGDMPIELAIQQGRFAYGARAASAQMTPPPHALRLSHVSPQVADLFERSFRHSAVGSFARPTAKEWVAALENLKRTLSVCARYPGHKFAKTASSSCPWCEIERAGGPDLFISITASAKLNSRFDVTLVWRQIETVPAPQKATAVSAAVAAPSLQVSLPFATAGWGFATVLVGILALVALGVGFVGYTGTAGWGFILGILWLALRQFSPYGRARRDLTDESNRTKAELARAEQDWRSKADAAIKAFEDKRRDLEKMRAEYQALPQTFRREEEELQSKKRENQLKSFLRAHFIEDATIKGIGPGRISVLRSFGIETALDCVAARITAVDGFGPTRTAAVMAWRASVESRFRFDPTKSVDPAERTALQQRQSQRRSALEASITKGLSDLKQSSSSATQAWTANHQRYEAAARNYAAANAKVQALTIPTWAA